MENQKKELKKVIDSIHNPKLIDYLYKLIFSFIEMRS